MSSLLNRLRSHRRSAIVAVLLGVLLRGLIPLGFMPSHSADGLTITICSGTSSYAVELPVDGGGTGTAAFPDGHACVFGSMVSADPSSPYAKSPPPVIAAYRLPEPVSVGADARLPLLSAPPLPARGPPSQA
jgi:hypothetical protein